MPLHLWIWPIVAVWPTVSWENWKAALTFSLPGGFVSVVKNFGYVKMDRSRLLYLRLWFFIPNNLLNDWEKKKQVKTSWLYRKYKVGMDLHIYEFLYIYEFMCTCSYVDVYILRKKKKKNMKVLHLSSFTSLFPFLLFPCHCI